MFPSQGANKWTRNYFSFVSRRSQKRQLIFTLLEFDLKFSCASGGLRIQNTGTFLRVLPRVLSLVLTKSLPLSWLLPCHSRVGWQEQCILLSKFRILTCAKFPKIFCPHAFRSLPCCLETYEHQAQLFHTVGWPSWRNDQETNYSIYCLIITRSFINRRESAGQLHNFIIWWLSFLFLFRDHCSSTKGSPVSEIVLLMFLFWKIEYIGKVQFSKQTPCNHCPRQENYQQPLAVPWCAFLCSFKILFIYCGVTGAEGERERVLSRSYAQQGSQHGAGSHDPEIMTWAEIKSHILSQQSYPGAPITFLIMHL